MLNFRYVTIRYVSLFWYDTAMIVHSDYSIYCNTYVFFVVCRFFFKPEVVTITALITNTDRCIKLAPASRDVYST